MKTLRVSLCALAIAGLASLGQAAFPRIAATASSAVGKACTTCPFCSEQKGPTFVEDFAQASLVVVGTFSNPKLGANGFDSTTEFNIDQVVKDHEAIKGMKKITLPRYQTESKTKFLVFCDVYKGNLDPYRGVELAADTHMVKYLQGATATKGKSQPDRLRFYFDFLNSPEIEIALDAYREFARADYKDYSEMAKHLPAKTIVGWIEDKKTPAYRLGLYASLLGHCGTAQDALILKRMIDDPEARRGSGVDGMMAGWVMIEPKAAWTYLNNLLQDEKQDFNFRYSIFRTARFMWDNRPELLPKETLVRSIGDLTQTADMADFAVDELRKWKRWEFTEPIIELFGKKSHQLSVVRRAILRFCLQSPHDSAKRFVDEQRKRDAEWVKDTEELLKLEADTK
jgi:hypothetical protein